MLSTQHTMKSSTQSSHSAAGIMFWVCQSPQLPAADNAKCRQRAKVKPGFRIFLISKACDLLHR